MLLLAVLPGCEARGPNVDELGLAPLLAEPQPWRVADWPLPRQPSESPEARPDRRRAQIAIEMKFLAGTVRALEAMGLAGSAGGAVVPADKVHAAAHRRGLPAVDVLSAPRLTVLAGQEAFVAVQTERAMVTDHALAREGESADGPLRPVVSTVPEGICAAIAADVKDDRIVLTKVHAVQARLLDARPRSAVVRVGGADRPCSWHEPLVLIGRCEQIGKPPVALKADECLVLPLAYGLAQCPPATVRLLAGEGTVREGSSRPRRAGGRAGAAINRQLILAVSARRVRGEDTGRTACRPVGSDAANAP